MQLSGTIPAFLGTLVKLEELKLEHNSLTGTIPPELGNMSGALLGHVRQKSGGCGMPAEIAAARGFLQRS